MNAFRLLTIAVFAAATVPRLAHRGMFVDGVTYASIARNLAEGRGTFNAPEVTVVKVPADNPAPAADGIDWRDAGIGAAGVLGLTLVAIGGGIAVVKTSRTSRTA